MFRRKVLLERKSQSEIPRRVLAGKTKRRRGNEKEREREERARKVNPGERGRAREFTLTKHSLRVQASRQISGRWRIGEILGIREITPRV